MSNLFIDIGTHIGVEFIQFIKHYKMYEEPWVIHTFEPHPNLFQMKGNREDFKHLNEALSLIPSIYRHNVACADRDGFIDLYIDKFLDQNAMGSTTFKPIADNPEYKNPEYDLCDVPALYKPAYITPPIKVPCIDTYKFIKSIVEAKQIDKLLIKINCEGEEFSILDSFLKNPPFNVKNCVLACELHYIFLEHYTSYPTFHSYKDRLKNKGITLVDLYKINTGSEELPKI